MFLAKFTTPSTISSYLSLHVESRARTTILAVILEKPHRRTRNGGLSLGIAHHEHGGLAAEFQSTALQI
jgi:hypothetical protein